MQEGAGNAAIVQQGRQQMGDINEARTPLAPLAIGLLQKQFQVLADEQVPGTAGGLIRAEVIQLIQQTRGIEGQGIHPGGVALVIQQHLQQVLHVHLAVAPAAGLLLAGQQEVPAGIAEAIRNRGEAGGASGVGIRPHGRESSSQSVQPCSRRGPRRRQ